MIHFLNFNERTDQTPNNDVLKLFLVDSSQHAFNKIHIIDRCVLCILNILERVYEQIT